MEKKTTRHPLLAINLFEQNRIALLVGIKNKGSIMQQRTKTTNDPYLQSLIHPSSHVEAELVSMATMDRTDSGACADA